MSRLGSYGPPSALRLISSNAISANVTSTRALKAYNLTKKPLKGSNPKSFSSIPKASLKLIWLPTIFWDRPQLISGMACPNPIGSEIIFIRNNLFYRVLILPNFSNFNKRSIDIIKRWGSVII